MCKNSLGVKPVNRESKLTVVPGLKKLTDNDRADILDRALTAAERELIPLLLHESASNTFADFLQHVHAHLKIELNSIRTGKMLVRSEVLPAVEKLREQYVTRKNAPVE